MKHKVKITASDKKYDIPITAEILCRSEFGSLSVLQCR